MSEKIKVIKCLSEEHGKKIIEYLESICVVNENYIGDSVDLFYGIKDGKIARFTHRDIFSEAYGKLYENFEIIELPEANAIPEKWCIEMTEEVHSYIAKLDYTGLFHDKDHPFTIGGYYSSVQDNAGYYGFSHIPIGFKEITFDQFKQYILKVKPMSELEELKSKVAEYQKLKQEKEELIKMLEKVHEVNRIHFFNGHNVNDQILTIIQKHKKGG